VSGPLAPAQGLAKHDENCTKKPALGKVRSHERAAFADTSGLLYRADNQPSVNLWERRLRIRSASCCRFGGLCQDSAIFRFIDTGSGCSQIPL
jgi:hypothetical protein